MAPPTLERRHGTLCGRVAAASTKGEAAMAAKRLENTGMHRRYHKSFAALAQVLYGPTYFRVTTRHTVWARCGTMLKNVTTRHTVWARGGTELQERTDDHSPEEKVFENFVC